MIDQKITAAHQWIVDESERQPKWWCEHVAWAYTAVGLTADGLALGDGYNIVFAAINLFGGVLCIFAARVPFILSAVGGSGNTRAMFWALFALRLSLLVQTPNPWRALNALHEAVGLSYLYFATCRPPRPRRRRQQVAMKRSTA